MRKKRFRKVLGTALCAAMIVGGVNFVPGNMPEVKAASSVKDVNLGTGGIINPTEGGSSAGNWEGSKVYFGSEENKNLWRVLDAAAGLVFADDVVAGNATYSTSGIDWDTAKLNTWLNSTDYKKDSSKFSAIEQHSIKSNMELLTLDDVKNMNYGFPNNNDSSAARSAAKAWWLRTAVNPDDPYIIYINEDGSIYTAGTRFYEERAVRPAFKMDLSSVFFTSAADTEKPSTFDMVGDENASANTWKLAIKDGDTAFATDTLPDAGTIGQDITVNVTQNGTGAYTQTSAMLEDAGGTVVAYGKIGDAATGEKTFTIPDSVTEGNYTLHVFEEHINGENKTDYVSKEVTQSITLSEQPAVFNVQVTAGANMTKTDSSGAESQTGLIGAMTDVVYTANAGYYFPADYSVASVNGITVTRNTNTQITVSGTPTEDAAIVLSAAKAKPVILAGAGKTHILGSAETLSITCSGALEDLTAFYVNGAQIDAQNYTLESGSTVLTLKAEYLNKLDVGTYTLKFVYGSESAETTFKIAAASGTVTPGNTVKPTYNGVPKTGDNTPFIWLSAFIAISGIGIFYFGRKKISREM